MVHLRLTVLCFDNSPLTAGRVFDSSDILHYGSIVEDSDLRDLVKRDKARKAAMGCRVESRQLRLYRSHRLASCRHCGAYVGYSDFVSPTGDLAS